MNVQFQVLINIQFGQQEPQKQLSPMNNMTQKSAMKQKLIQILGGGQQEDVDQQNQEKKTILKKSLGNAKSELSYPKDYSSEIYIGNKVFQVSPKNNQQRFFDHVDDQDYQRQKNMGYCISVGNLLIQPKSNKHKNHKSQTNYQNSSNQLAGKYKQNQTEQNIRSESVEQKKQPNQKRKSLIRQNQKQNLFQLIKTINQFMNQSKQKQKDELSHINQYLEKNNIDISKQFQEFVKSFPLIKTKNNKSEEIFYQTDKTSLLNLFKQLNKQEILEEQQNQQSKPTTFKTKRPPQLDTQQAQPNFLSYKNSYDQEIKQFLEDDSQEKNLIEQSVSSPQFLDVPNSSSTNIQAQQKEYSSILNSQQKIKKIKEQELEEVLNKTKKLLNKSKQKINKYKEEQQKLKAEVEYWKNKYLEIVKSDE